MDSNLNGKRLYIRFSQLQDVDDKLRALRAALGTDKRTLTRLHLDLNNAPEQSCLLVEYLENLTEIIQLSSCTLKDLEIVYDAENKDNRLPRCLIKLVSLPTCRLTLSPRFFHGLEEEQVQSILKVIASSRFFAGNDLWITSTRRLAQEDSGACLLLEHHSRSRGKGTLKLSSSRHAVQLFIHLVQYSGVESLQAPLLRETLQASECCALQTALAYNRTLRSLRLFLNQHAPNNNADVSEAIFRALTTANQTLSRLALHPVCWKSLVTHLPLMQGLQSLRVAGPPCDETAAQLVAALQQNTSMQEWNKVATQNGGASRKIPPVVTTILQRNRRLHQARRVHTLTTPGELYLLLDRLDYSSDMQVSASGIYTLIRKFLPPILVEGSNDRVVA